MVRGDCEVMNGYGNAAPFRYLRAILNLRPGQVLRRVLTRVDRVLPHDPKRWSFPGGRSPSVRTDLSPALLLPAPQSPEIAFHELSKGIFRHLNRSRTLGLDRPDWRLGPCSEDRLWTITLHYHEWAYSLAHVAAGDGENAPAAAKLFRHYLDDWMIHCDLARPGSRELAWNPYAIATRIGWWVRCFLLAEPKGAIFEPDFRASFLRSLWQQAKYLRDHLEWDLRANHLLRDAVGLAWAGRFFAEPECREWLRKAEKIASSQADEQVLPDGGHFERTPAYHIHVMEDFLTLGHLLEDPDARDKVRTAWHRMAGCIAWMRHPDGQIPLLNDSTLNSALAPDEALKRGEQIGYAVSGAFRQGGRLFRDFGVFVWHGNPWTVFFDVGLIGVRYQLGHGHADTLTLEVSLRGSRLVVDPGTRAYDWDSRRQYDRSTRAHNTVAIDGHDSSEVWHIFRCGRTARPTLVQAEWDSDGFRVVCSHDGYRHLSGSPRHVRTVELHGDRVLAVTDRCEGSGVHHLSGGWLLDPRWAVETRQDGWRLACPDCGSIIVRVQGPAGLKLMTEPRWYHPEFGLEVDTIRLEWEIQAQLPVEVRTTFAP